MSDEDEGTCIGSSGSLRFKPKDFSQPTEVADIDIHFSVAGGPIDEKSLMPTMGVIPDEFKRHRHGTPAMEWIEFQRTWFFLGLDSIEKVKAKPGVDKNKALRHLKAIQTSFEPKAEHKEAAVAYLASLWLESWR